MNNPAHSTPVPPPKSSTPLHPHPDNVGIASLDGMRNVRPQSKQYIRAGVDFRSPFGKSREQCAKLPRFPSEASKCFHHERHEGGLFMSGTVRCIGEF